MRIKTVSIERYKNLHDFECEFSDSNISAFIGNNGSGKSNLLEVIANAFSNAKTYLFRLIRCLPVSSNTNCMELIMYCSIITMQKVF